MASGTLECGGAAAKEDAARQGLMQAVGMLVDVQQVTEGEQLVRDRILGATSALVVESKVVTGSTRLGDGTYEVESDVRIRRRTLVDALTDARFSVTGGTDGDSAVLSAEANFRNAKEAEALLAERLSNLESKLLVGRLLDDSGIPHCEGELPTVVKQDDGTVVICAKCADPIPPRVVLHQVRA